MDTHLDPARGRADLMAAVIEHLACYLQTGRPRSARLAMLLLDRLAQDTEADPQLRERCRQLNEVLEDHGEGPHPMAAQSVHRPASLPTRPWLTWEVLGEAA